MQPSFREILEFVAVLISIVGGVWVIINRFAKLEGRVDHLEHRVGRLESKVDEILAHLKKIDEVLFYLAPKFKRKKIKQLHRKH